jgi:hypothetical protein
VESIGRPFLSDDTDLLDRLGDTLTDTKTACYAWVLIPNHFHLLLRRGTTPFFAVMRRDLTGYAVSSYDTGAVIIYFRTASKEDLGLRVFVYTETGRQR